MTQEYYAHLWQWSHDHIHVTFTQAKIMHCNAVWNYTYLSCHMPLTQINAYKQTQQTIHVRASTYKTSSFRSPLVFITLSLMLVWVASHWLCSALNFSTTQWSKLFKLNHPQHHWLFMHILAQLSFARETSDSQWLASFPGLPHDLGMRLTQWSFPRDPKHETAHAHVCQQQKVPWTPIIGWAHVCKW